MSTVVGDPPNSTAVIVDAAAQPAVLAALPAAWHAAAVAPPTAPLLDATAARRPVTLLVDDVVAALLIPIPPVAVTTLPPASVEGLVAVPTACPAVTLPDATEALLAAVAAVCAAITLPPATLAGDARNVTPPLLAVAVIVDAPATVAALDATPPAWLVEPVPPTLVAPLLPVAPAPAVTTLPPATPAWATTLPVRVAVIVDPDWHAAPLDASPPPCPLVDEPPPTLAGLPIPIPAVADALVAPATLAALAAVPAAAPATVDPEASDAGLDPVPVATPVTVDPPATLAGEERVEPPAAALIATVQVPRPPLVPIVHVIDSVPAAPGMRYAARSMRPLAPPTPVSPVEPVHVTDAPIASAFSFDAEITRSPAVAVVMLGDRVVTAALASVTAVASCVAAESAPDHSDRFRDARSVDPNVAVTLVTAAAFAATQISTRLFCPAVFAFTRFVHVFPAVSAMLVIVEPLDAIAAHSTSRFPPLVLRVTASVETFVVASAVA